MNPTDPNPAAAFYRHPLIPVVVAGIKGVNALSPAAGTRLATRLFSTPIPFKTRARRRPVPAGWRHQALRTDAGEIAVWRLVGTAPAAEPVLLIHGWAGSASDLMPIGESLVTRGLAPVAVDLPAHGHSRGWQTNGFVWSRTLRELQRATGSFRAVVAHSLGALATAHALGHGLRSERAVLLAPSAPPSDFIAWAGQAMGLPAGTTDAMRALLERRESASMRELEIDPLADGMRLPTLLVHDRDDPAAPHRISRHWSRREGVELVTTSSLGHRRILRDPAVHERIGTFLAR
ncbi:MAG: alpha/beta hydrolase [Nocardioides sp.]